MSAPTNWSRAWQPGAGCAGRERDCGMAGQVEELRQPEHDRSDRLVPLADLHRLGADERRRNRQRRQHQCVVARQHRAHVLPKNVTHVERVAVVGGRDQPAHLQPLTHGSRVLFGHPLERGSMIRKCVREHDVEVRGGDRLGVRNCDVRDMRAGRTQAFECLIEPPSHLVVQQIEEVGTRDGQAQAAQSGRADRSMPVGDPSAGGRSFGHQRHFASSGPT